MPKNWKYIKKQLEKEFLCEKLRGHITYDLTDYRPAPWYQQHFAMKWDNTFLLEAAQAECAWDKKYRYSVLRDDHISRFVHKALNSQQYDFGEISSYDIEQLASAVVKTSLVHMSHYDGVYGVKEIMDAIGTYLHGSIQENLRSEEYFVVALAVLDRRCGKRTLSDMAQRNWVGYPDWLKRIFCLRFEAEGIRCSSAYKGEGSEKTV